VDFTVQGVMPLTSNLCSSLSMRDEEFN
jgi:hypothetical protein